MPKKMKKKAAPSAPRPLRVWGGTAKKKPAAVNTSARRKRKLALVMSGGGMKCVYGVGILTALVEEYGLTKPDIIVAASGSVPNAAYYLAGQYREVISVWLALLGSKKFISWERRKVIDIDYLVDDIFKKRHPLDLAALSRARTKFFFPVTRVEDGRTLFLTLPKTAAVYERLRAAAAIPFVYNKGVRIGKEIFTDGDIGSNLSDLINKALAEGAEDIIAVDHDPGLNKKRSRKILMHLLAAEEKAAGKSGEALAALRELNDAEVVVDASVTRILTLSPTKPLGVKVLTRNKLALRTAFNLGYADATNSTELAKLLTDHETAYRK
jgi:predicted patatin/cPLA2 family phospholipase